MSVSWYIFDPSFAHFSSDPTILNEPFDPQRIYPYQELLKTYPHLVYSTQIHDGDFIAAPQGFPHAVTTQEESIGLSGYTG